MEATYLWNLCSFSLLFFVVICKFTTVSASKFLDHDGMPLDSFDHTSPHNITVEEISFTFIKISWDAPLDNETDILNYLVKYSPHWDRRHEVARSVPVDKRSFYLKGLMTGTRYVFYIVANYSNGKLTHSLNREEQTKGFGRDNPCSCSPWGSTSMNCNNQTGKCTCVNKYTIGQNCDSCYTGYYYHPQLGCEKCSCPDKLSNGSCHVDERGVVMCHCVEGHSGTQCNVCSRGFYARRHSNKCAPCMCYFNEDPNADLVCTNQGRCVACMYDTGGDHCELCLPGYEGDAKHHNCTAIAEKMMSHEAVVVVAVCLTIISIAIVIIVFVLYVRWRRCNNKPFNFWTVQLGNDHENVNFSAIVNQHDPNTIDAELLANDEVQFAAKEKPTLTFGSARQEKT